MLQTRRVDVKESYDISLEGAVLASERGLSWREASKATTKHHKDLLDMRIALIHVYTLYYTILHYTILYTILHYSILYYTMLYYIIPCYIL